MSTGTIVVTGATGHLGRSALEALLDRGVPASQLVATGRRVETLADLAARGVTVCRSNYDDPASLREAFAGAERLLLVSAIELGKRAAQHRNAIAAARDAGVRFIAYTSAPGRLDPSIVLTAEHRATEAALAESGVPHVVLRNSWYLEIYTGLVAGALENGVVLGAAKSGRVSAALRTEYAEAAAIAVSEDGHAGRTYELGSDTAFTLADLAGEIARQSGRAVTYRDLPAAEYAKALEGFGVSAPWAQLYARLDESLANDELLVTTGDLSRLLRRPTTTLSTAVAAALEQAKAA